MSSTCLHELHGVLTPRAIARLYAALAVSLFACTAPPASVPTPPGPSAGQTSAAGTPGQVASLEAAETPSSGLSKLEVGYSEIYLGQIPLWVAIETGIFADNGLDIDLHYTASTTAISALLSDQIQISNGGGAEALGADANGSDLVLVATTVPVQPYVFEVTPDITSISDLKDKKVGISSPGSSSDIATRIGLKRVGLDPDHDLTIASVGSLQKRTAALLSGSIQGALDEPPSSLELEAKGFHPLFNLAELKLPTLNNCIVVRRSYLSSQPDVVQRYVDSIIQAIAWARRNKDSTLPIIKKYLKVDDQDVLSRTYDFAFSQLFSALPYVQPEQFADSVDALSITNPKVRTIDVNTLLDNSLVQRAADRGLDR